MSPEVPLASETPEGASFQGRGHHRSVLHTCKWDGTANQKPQVPVVETGWTLYGLSSSAGADGPCGSDLGRRGMGQGEFPLFLGQLPRDVGLTIEMKRSC